MPNTIDNNEIQIYKDIVEDIKKQFKPYEVEVLIKIYRWTKSERNRYFFLQILKRLPFYKKAVKKLRNLYLIELVKSNDPHRITQDGMRTGGLLLQLRNLGFL